MKKHKFLKQKWIFTMLSFLLINGILFAQDLNISGTVKDVDGQPLAGANIIEKGTTNGTQADFDGNFSMKVKNANATLEISFLGFVQKQIPLNGKTVLSIVLKEDLESLDEIVLIGYGGVKKSDLTGSVSTVSAKDLNITVNQSFAQALEGRTSGVQVLSGEGTPGGDISIRVRGGTSISASNEPLYVIDGFPVMVESTVGSYRPEQSAATTSNPLSGIDPNDIESIQILKDASATAIYGSRGANGVVIIKTKKGKIGKGKVTFDSFYSSQEVANTLDMLNAQQYAQYRLDNDADPTTDLGLFLADVVNDPSLVEEYNWQDEIYRTAGIQSYRLGFSGGSKDLQYNLSLGAFLNEGIIKRSDFDRYNVRLNLNGNVSEKLKLSAVLSGSFIKQFGVPTAGNNGTRSGVVTNAINYPPFVLNGELDDDTSELAGAGNFNPLSTLLFSENETKRDFFQANVALDYMISERLVFRTLLGATTNNSKNARYASTRTAVGSLANGRASISQNTNRNWVNENTLTYTKESGDHNISILGGFTFQSAVIESFSTSNTDFAIENLGFNNLGAGSNPEIPSSNLESWSLASGLSRINYSYKDRYLVTASIRADGSSRFAEGNKWGYFPSLAVAWKLDQEPFLQNSKIIKSLKLRAGYGITGNQEVPRYQSLASLGTDFYSFGLSNGNITSAVFLDRVANPDLTWETTSQFNFGLDFGLFKNRISGSVDIYKKETEDMLLAVNLIPTAGIVSPALRNIGRLENKGLEIGITTRNIETDNFTWTTDFNISFNRNEVLELGATDEIFFDVTGGNHQVVNEVILKVGESTGTFFGYKTAGILGTDENGDPLPLDEGFVNETGAGGHVYVDQITVDTDGDGVPDARDGVINDDDRVTLGTSLPKHYGGFTNRFNYKGFDMNVFFNWSYGNSVYNANRVYHEELHNGANKSTAILNAWTQDNQDTDIAALGQGETSRFLGKYVEDGSYIRLKNVTLGYTLDKSHLEKTPFSSIRIYASGQNLWTSTDYKGYNPDANVSPLPVAGGVDWGAYPLPKIYTFGVNVSF